MQTVLITGGTGLIGTALSKALLGKGYNIIILTRNKSVQHSQNPSLQYAEWDLRSGTIEELVFGVADHIIHLAGANIVGKRWTEKRKKEIVSSRVDSSRLLVKYLEAYANKVRTVISASAIGWYGVDPVVPNPNPYKETDPPANDFLGTTCKSWEESISPVTSMGKRLVILRTGIVISPAGGALPRFIRPLKFGIAPILGNGSQIVSWIDMDDLVAIYIHALEDERMQGVYNAVAPNPISNKELVIKLAKSRKQFYISVPVPSFVLEVVLGRVNKEILKSATVSCAKVLASGFNFKSPLIEEALMGI